MENTNKLRQLYFAGLFSVFIYFAILIILLGKAHNKQVNEVYLYILAISSIVGIPVVWKRVKGDLFKEKNYKLSLILGHIPVFAGFILSILEKSYVYFLISFPVFILIYFILIPWRKNGI